MQFAVTMATRAPRDREVHGRDYFFVTREEFAALRDGGKMLEYAEVYEDWKGTPREQIEPALARGQDVLVRVDVQGAETICGMLPSAVSIFLAPASLAELELRLRRRGSESESELAVRLAKVRAEIARVPRFDYLVINPEGGLADAVAEVAAIIRAERRRVARLTV
jgi:guanylate kinase